MEEIRLSRQKHYREEFWRTEETSCHLESSAEDQFVSKVKIATVVEGDQRALLSITTTPRCRGGSYPFLWIAPLYP